MTIRDRGPNGDDPTPCLCGDLAPNACTSMPVASLPGVCRDEYVAAAGGTDLFATFFDDRYAWGVANNLYACDRDVPCHFCF